MVKKRGKKTQSDKKQPVSPGSQSGQSSGPQDRGRQGAATQRQSQTPQDDNAQKQKAQQNQRKGEPSKQLGESLELAGPSQQQKGLRQLRAEQPQQVGPSQQQLRPPIQQGVQPQQYGGPTVQPSRPHQKLLGQAQLPPSCQQTQQQRSIHQQRGEKRQQQTPPVQEGGQRGSPQKQETAQHQQKDKTQQQVARCADSGEGNSVSKVTPGREGKKIMVESNHFLLDLSKLNDKAYHYDVDIEPVEPKTKTVPKKLIRSIVNEFTRRMFPNRSPAFDGKKNMYTSTPLHPDLDMLFEEQVAIDDEGRTRTFKVSVKSAKTNPIDMTVIKNCLSIASTPREALQVIDIVLRMASSRNCLPVGRSFYKIEKPMDLSGGLEAYTGFYQSAIRGWKPLLNVDVSFKAFYKSIPVVDALLELFVYPDFQPQVECLANLRSYQSTSANKYLKMLRVQYELPNCRSSRRIYSVNELFSSASRHRFDYQGKTISVQEYFSQHKNYRIKYPDIPLLHVGDPNRANKTLIPMELCTIVPCQPLRGKSNNAQTRKMIRLAKNAPMHHFEISKFHQVTQVQIIYLPWSYCMPLKTEFFLSYAATSTDVRKTRIQDALKTADYNSSPAVREFNITVGNDFQQLQARVLNSPALKYGNDRTVNVFKGIWSSSVFFNPATIKLWTIAVAVEKFPPQRDQLQKMQKLLVSEANRAGMSFSSPAVEPFPTIGGRQTYADVLKFFQQQESKKYDIIFVVVPDSGPQYSYVKRAAETQTGCLTQCVKQTTVCSKMNQATALNILLKVNSKMNGTNHALGDRPPILRRPVMIMGADVTHPSPDSKNIPSVAAVTASHDSNAFKYNICWRLQDPKLEIIGDLKNIVIEQLHFYKQQTNLMPEAIVFFRDGVSEGEFNKVVTKEVAAIKGACKQIQKEGFEPRVTFLVVQKRHHTRLFPKDSRDSQDNKNNVPAGTCVDTDITHPFMTDFYLVSHVCSQGVAKPTKYCVLYDDNNMDHDQIEQLTYYLCHMFTRCNRSVSYPAPTYYAHLAADRCKTYIKEHKINLKNLEQEFRRYQIKDSIRKDKPMFFV
ncbi:protein argonaute-2-like isoform X2 [Rhynchophorus ferrugineus]|uniref:protein argonaute-2-like isoform X2 n=1 Tax=Rhynchophorus ferrugineus TaxID=354439 RepID=UPI003FCD49BE